MFNLLSKWAHLEGIMPKISKGGLNNKAEGVERVKIRDFLMTNVGAPP